MESVKLFICFFNSRNWETKIRLSKKILEVSVDNKPELITAEH